MGKIAMGNSVQIGMLIITYRQAFQWKGRKYDIFRLTIWSDSLCETSNGNVVRVVNFATSKM
jgi:hypothetical protein